MPLHAGVQQAPRKQVKYSLAEIDSLAAYIQENGGGPTVPEGDLTDGDLALGGALFRTNCASCHNFAGSGGALTYGKYAPTLKPSSARVIYTAMQHGPGEHAALQRRDAHAGREARHRPLRPLHHQGRRRRRCRPRSLRPVLRGPGRLGRRHHRPRRHDPLDRARA
jgi:mono/diheme cytochrome c family protein